MPFLLSEEERLVSQTVREFARRVGLEKAAEADRFDRVPEDVLKEAAGLGLATMSAPVEQGGAGAGPTAFALALYEMAQVCPNTAAVLAVQNAAVRALVQANAGGDLIAGVNQGEFLSLLVAEEAHGSDTGHFGTVAVPEGAGFRVTGQKVWGMAAAIAKHHLVVAHAEGAGATLVNVAAGAQGVVLSANEPLLGLRASGIRTLYMSNVHAAQPLGVVGKGLDALAAARPWLQIGAAAALCGCVAGGLESAARFAESRVQFGHPIGSYQAVSDAVTNMDIQLAAARALTFEAASHLDTPEAGAWAARAKTFAGEMAVAMTRQAIRVQGGTGFMREGGTERFARDARALQFVGETGHMQRDALKRVILPGVEFPAAP